VHAVRNEQSPSYKAVKDRHFGLILNQTPNGNGHGGNESDVRPFIIYTFPEKAGVPQSLQILYVQQPFPFEAVVAAARKEGCATIKLWGEQGDWDDHHPSMEKDANMPCMVVYDNPTSETKWEWLEQ